MYVFSSIKPDLTMDGASLGFSLINRPAAGRCVFSTSLVGQDDVHGTTGWAGRQAGVRACYSARTLLGVQKVLGHDTTAHPSISTNRGAWHSIRAVRTCMCHVVDQPWRATQIPDQDNTAHSKHPITIGFWTDTVIPTVTRVSYYCRFLQTGSVLQLHCRSFTQPDRVQFHQHCRFIRPPDSVNSNISVGLCFNRLYCRNQHCRFITRPDSDG